MKMLALLSLSALVLVGCENASHSSTGNKQDKTMQDKTMQEKSMQEKSMQDKSMKDQEIKKEVNGMKPTINPVSVPAPANEQ